jgi:archaemetzincin
MLKGRKMFCGIVAVIALSCFLSCGRQKEHIDEKWIPKNTKETIVMLQPLSFSNKMLNMLKDSIPAYYPVRVVLAANRALPANAWYAPRGRYEADSILVFLQGIKPATVRLVAGLTDKDISTRKDDNPDYGIMGYGLRPGDVCVVSTYRLQKDHPSQKLLFQRLLKTTLHEIGHNFGLPHCADRHCIMADAEGRLSQDDETGLCTACRKKLKLP